MLCYSWLYLTPDDTNLPCNEDFIATRDRNGPKEEKTPADNEGCVRGLPVNHLRMKVSLRPVLFHDDLLGFLCLSTLTYGGLEQPPQSLVSSAFATPTPDRVLRRHAGP